MARTMSTRAAATQRTPSPPAGSNYPVLKDKKLVAMVDEYARLSSEKSLAEARMKELKPEIEAALGDAPTAYIGTRVVSMTEVPAIPATPNRVITREMIGQVIPGERGRRAYTMLKVQ